MTLSRAHLYFLSRMLRLFDTAHLAELEYWDEKLGDSRYTVLKIFLNEGMVELLSGREQIAEDRSVASLKTLCKERGLKLSGKKADLIERLLASDPRMEATLAPVLRFVRCTDAGRRIVMAYYSREVENYRAVEAKVRVHLCDGNLTDAIRAANAYKADMLFPQGSEPERFQIKVLGGILSSTLGNQVECMEAAVMYLMPEWYPGRWTDSTERSQDRAFARELIQSARAA